LAITKPPAIAKGEGLQDHYTQIICWTRPSHNQGLLVVAAGIVVGFLLSYAVGKLIQDFLVGINSTDALTYTAITLFLGLVAMAACFIPVRRALRIDPMLVLRNE